MPNINGFHYRGIKRYKDRSGKIRYYFRESGQALPNPENDFREFDQAYSAAVDAHKAGLKPKPIKEPCEFRGARSRPNLPPLLVPTMICPQQHAGVYLLFHQGALTYIGESANMPKRIKEHASNGRPFDRAYFIKTGVKERFAVESMLIAALHAPQNRSTGRRFASSEAEPT